MRFNWWSAVMISVKKTNSHDIGEKPRVMISVKKTNSHDIREKDKEFCVIFTVILANYFTELGIERF